MIRTSTNHINDIIVDTTHINRIYADGDIIHGVTPPLPVQGTPLQIGSDMRYFMMNDFTFKLDHTNNKNIHTTFAILMNLGQQPAYNSLIVRTMSPWNQQYGFGFWKEHSGFGLVRPGTYWYTTVGDITQFYDTPYWFVYDSTGTLRVYSATVNDTDYHNNNVIYSYDVVRTDSYIQQLKTLYVFGEPNASEPMINATVYRILYNRDNTLDETLVHVVENNTHYFKNLHTGDMYEVKDT